MTRAQCLCTFACDSDPRTACSLSGTYHLHSEDGACPQHPNAVVVWDS